MIVRKTLKEIEDSRKDMASILRKKKRKRDTMDRPDTIDYNEALKDPAWDNERKWERLS